jgi:protein TonB
LEPTHIQVHGPLPATAEAVPTLHRFELGGELAATPFAEPQTPLMAGLPPDPVPPEPLPPEPVLPEPPAPVLPELLLPEGTNVA